MYTITARYNVSYHNHNIFFVSDLDSLFALCQMLQDNDLVMRYKVTNDGSTYIPENFGWADMNKWCDKLYPDKLVID